MERLRIEPEQILPGASRGGGLFRPDPLGGRPADPGAQAGAKRLLSLLPLSAQAEPASASPPLPERHSLTRLLGIEVL